MSFCDKIVVKSDKKKIYKKIFPQGLHDNFKSSDDWLDDWEEIDRVEKKPVIWSPDISLSK